MRFASQAGDGTRRPTARCALAGAGSMKFDGHDEAKENEILSGIIAVLLAGAVTFVIWAIFGQG